MTQKGQYKLSKQTIVSMEVEIILRERERKKANTQSKHLIFVVYKS